MQIDRIDRNRPDPDQQQRQEQCPMPCHGVIRGGERGGAWGLGGLTLGRGEGGLRGEGWAMASEFDGTLSGLVAFQLSLHTLLTLKKRGVLSADDVIDITENSMLGLETIQAKRPPEDQETFAAARALLLKLRSDFSR